jgi:type I restriction enzyme M protein
MTNEQLKDLENKLWDSANALRAYGGIKAADYAVPVLGLIFLQFADNKYSHYEEEIVKEYKKDKGTRLERTIDSIAIAKCGFYLPDFARYDYLLNLPGDKSMAKALSKAMKGIEDYQDEKFKDVLPKDAFFDIEKKKSDILPGLLKTFSDIPKDATGDIFGKIYEYFLGEFAMSEGQKGGEFFTPTSVVRFIVEVIEPYAGKIYDPACGSGGMFVQSAKFIQETKHDINDIFVYGQEYMGETVRLAKMNLMVNNIRGEITEVNSYENDPYKSLGKFDFVMANPPFNVKSVKETTVKNDERFTKFGLPKNKGKNTDDSITDANYLWISLFATSLNEKGRAGFVMANSASDAGNSEYDIRKQIVDSGMVDCMVSMPSNMFFTVTLPATLWFFDKQKIKTNRKDKILFIDARNTYHQINRAQREWKEEQIQNLAAIVRLYRGENERYLELVTDYARKADESIKKLPTSIDVLHKKIVTSLTNLKQYATNTKSKLTKEDQKKLEESGFIKKLNEITNSKLTLPKFSWNKEIPKTNKQLLAFGETFTEYVASLKELDTNLKKK